MGMQNGIFSINIDRVMTLHDLKVQLNRVFDDDLHTKQWHNIVDWMIMGLILISTIEVFLSTFDSIAERYGKVLIWIDWITQVFFTIEVTLRIWNADMLDPKYKGFKGRLRYCFSFYGLIDILSTYPFYVNMFVALPYSILKALRVARLLRVFRYMHSFKLLSSAIKSKKSELLVSLQFLTIVTIILSFILFFVEHQAQPEVYDNGWRSVVWAFAQYIQDPGGFADTPPITLTGQIISVIVGVLGIAIFAVPAGLIGSGFTEVMEEEQKEKELKDNASAINEMMLVKSVKREGIFFPAKNLSFGDIVLDLGLSEEEIVKAVSLAQNLRIKNLAAAVNDGPKTDMMVVNQFSINKEYGCCLNRESSVTIVNPLGIGDNGLSYFDWHIAQLGGFNYVSNELYSRTCSDRNRRVNFYTVTKETESNSVFQQFVNDILADKGKGDWIIIIAGEQVVKNKTHFHFEFGGEKGEQGFDFEGGITPDRKKLKVLFEDFSRTLEAKANLVVDAHQVQPRLNENNIARYLQARTEANVLLITVSYKLMVFDKEVYSAIYNVADILNRNLESKKSIGLHIDEYKVRPIESKYWTKLYGVEQ
jgi:voltage-gated potassium channel